MTNLKPIRRAQLINQFGVGALVDFRGDESLMTAGLDHWPYSKDQCPNEWLVTDERLQARLKMTHFRLPPEYREPGTNIQFPRQYIPFVRFPRWHYCPRRGAMERLTLFNDRRRCPCRPGLDCPTIDWKRPWLIPSRFITVCPKGHIEDFPFMDWVHRGEDYDDKHKLRLLASRSSASLSGIKVSCSCGKEESMAASFNFDAKNGGPLHRIGYDCSGGMPWLGTEGKSNKCGENLRVVQRGASNVFFPLTVSSIYLPRWGEEKSSSSINKIIDNQKNWNVLTAVLDEGKYIQPLRCEITATNYGVDPEELKQAAQRKLDGQSVTRNTKYRSDEEYRYQEFEALRNEKGGPSTDLLIEKRDSDEYGPNLAKLLNSICLVKKLRETRVYTGFSRLLPVEDATVHDLLPVSLDTDLKWLPATVVFGEGIFFEFKAEEIQRWSENQNVKDRVSLLREGYNQKRLERGLVETEVTAKYVFLHTFAHILIGQLSYDCGYGSASLRERIYCEQNDSDRKMQGVLIYTASGDSEGTLGGLVRQGEPNRMNGVIARAILGAQWCSSDPVCIESFGQGNQNANRAACHNCVLLPETSCEKGNRLLDRGLIVGTTIDPGIGLFSGFTRN